MARRVLIPVVGRLDSASRAQRGTMVIERERDLISVRPLRRHRTYDLPASFVAEMICRHVIRLELEEKRRARRPRRGSRP